MTQQISCRYANATLGHIGCRSSLWNWVLVKMWVTKDAETTKARYGRRLRLALLGTDTVEVYGEVT